MSFGKSVFPFPASKMLLFVVSALVLFELSSWVRAFFFVKRVDDILTGLEVVKVVTSSYFLGFIFVTLLNSYRHDAFPCKYISPTSFVGKKWLFLSTEWELTQGCVLLKVKVLSILLSFVFSLIKVFSP